MIYRTSTALIVVDVQNDFADPDGSLYVDGGQEIIDGINAEVAAARAAGSVIVATQDWHPTDTPHFEKDGGVWPVHCVRQTWGAQLHPGLDADVDLILRKGSGGEDGYSAFGVADPGTGATRPTGLAAFLHARNVTALVVVGLAGDVCVKETAGEGVEEGFAVTVPWDLTRSVDLTAGDGDRAAAELTRLGVDVRA